MKPILLIGILASLFLIWFSALGQSTAENLVANPGFEEGSEAVVSDWTMQGDVAWVTDEVHSGSRAVRVSSQGGSAGVKSNFFQAPPHTRLEVAAWIKSQDVEASGHYQMMRVTLGAYRGDRATRIRHWDLLVTHGSLDWQQIRAGVIVPEGTQYLRLELRLTDTTGTFWVDDVEVRIIQTVPEVDLNLMEAPLILPEPWQIKNSRDYLPIHALVIRSCESSERFTSALQQYLEETNIPYMFSSFDIRTDFESAHLIVGGECNNYLSHQLSAFDGDVDWDVLGDQGYLLRVDVTGDQPLIYLSARSETGRYYALQTLKQLLNDRARTLQRVEILDRPVLPLRGMIMGVQWFSEQNEFLRRASELKINMIWNQGSFLNEKFWFRWREPLNDGEQETMRAYLENARSHFIEPSISIAPRGRSASDPTYYSSEQDISLVVNKFAVLYQLGYRNFGLSFDDLANFGQDRLFGPDIEIFENDIGEAHRYFVDQVYQQMQASFPDSSLTVVPMVYSGLDGLGTTDRAYLEALGRLPVEVQLFTSPEYQVEADIVRQLTGRPHLVWDNYYAYFYEEDAPEYIIPINRPATFVPGSVAGYVMLPFIPDMEDEVLISWRTAANYAWNPERYDPMRAFQLAAARHMGWKYSVTGE
jgi:hypothetical protein